MALCYSGKTALTSRRSFSPRGSRKGLLRASERSDVLGLVEVAGMDSTNLNDLRKMIAAIDHLRNLLSTGCMMTFTTPPGDFECFYCHAYLEDEPDAHKPDCPYLAAQAFVDSLDSSSSS